MQEMASCRINSHECPGNFIEWMQLCLLCHKILFILTKYKLPYFSGHTAQYQWLYGNCSILTQEAHLIYTNCIKFTQISQTVFKSFTITYEAPDHIGACWIKHAQLSVYSIQSGRLYAREFNLSHMLNELDANRMN